MKKSHASFIRPFLLTTCIVSSGVLSVSCAHAQSAPVSGQGGAPVDSTAPAANTPAQLDEIVVTAERRAESLEKVPVAVTAVSAATLRALNVTSAQDLTQVVPNLVVGENGSSAQVGMRGAISTTPGVFADPAVGFSVDGVYIARGGSALASLYDISQVEVLRGPQGTLYGRNTIAGLINVITSKPDLDKFEGRVGLGYGNYNDLQTEGMVNVPLSPTLAVRGAFSTDRHDGYSNNAPGRDYNDLDSVAGRVELYWKPSPSFNALLTGSMYHNGGVGGGSISGGAPLGLYAVSAGATPYNYQEADGNAYTEELTRDATLTLNYVMPFATLTYVGSYRSDHYSGSGQLAVQGDIVNSFGGLCATAASPTCFTLAARNYGWQTSHEVRLGNATPTLKWVVGLYYYKYSDTNVGGITPSPSGQPIDLFTPGANEETTHAAFGQVTWSPIERLRLTGGIRYNDEYKLTTSQTFTGPVGSFTGFACNGCTAATGIQGGASTIHKVTWRAGADADLTRNTMVFVSAANGFKNGGTNNDGSIYLPEVIMNYELGMKNDLFAHRLQINIDAFHELYTNYQSTAGEESSDGTVNLETVNAGKATINGIELESQGLLSRDDRVSFNATYLHARFTSFYLPNGDGFDNYQPENLSGNKVPYAPDVTLRLSYYHTFRLDSGATVVPGVDTSYVASQELDYHNFSVLHVPSYTRTGLSLTYNSPKEAGRVPWSIMAWAKNLENHAVLVTGQVDNAVPANLIGLVGKDGFYLAPRTYGVKLTASF